LKNIIEEISSCTDDSALLDVGKMYYDHYIRACAFPFPIYSSICSLNLMLSPVRANRSRIPTPFNDESPPSFDTITEMTARTLVEAPKSHTDAKKNVSVVLSFRE
jgi:hypothetical protein